MNRLLLLVCFCLMTHPLRAAEETIFPFVLPWDDASPSITNISSWLEKPAGKNGFITSRDGHLYSGDKRFRIFGVNMCFGANFPEHKDADQIAARLAKFGINCVRFHHMDMFAAPNGIFQKDMQTLDPGQLDKLDYFIAKLKEHGIYSNLNLHVSLTYPGMPSWENAPSFFKGVDLFYPPMLEMQRNYARQLLTHINPYTKLAYTQDPAIALVEINNENGLILEWWNGSLDEMPEPYRIELQKQWQGWLKRKYPEPQTLVSAWNQNAESLGRENLLQEKRWFLEQHQGAKAVLEDGLNIRVQEKGAESWHVQISQDVAFVVGKNYTLSFRAKAEKPRNLGIVASQAHEPWKHGWTTTVKLTTEWKEFRFSFRGGEGLEKGRLLFSGMGLDTGLVSLDSLSLLTGGTYGLKDGEKPEDVQILAKKDYASRTATAQRDWMTFLWDLEEAYWAGMSDFVRKELGSRSLMVGTAVGFSPSPIQAKLDVVDGHVYWQHPHFPGKSWDQENWTVNNIPMAGVENGGSLSWLALRRVAGKPFIVTEYNSSAPNSYGAETFLLLGSYAALQDWDGVFAFAYSHRRDSWDTQHVPGFFDIDQHPVKMATLPPAIAMFMRGDVAAAGSGMNGYVTRAMGIDQSMISGPWWDLGAFGVQSRYALAGKTQMELGHFIAENLSPLPKKNERGIDSFTGELFWGTQEQSVKINTPRSKALIGKHNSEPVKLGNIGIQPVSSLLNWSAITVTAMDGATTEEKGRLLITATGWTENTGQQWKDEKKTSVGKNWGKAPSMAEGIAARITLPQPPSRMKVFALDEKGQPGPSVPLSTSGTGSVLEIGPQYKTLWYQVEIQ